MMKFLNEHTANPNIFTNQTMQQDKIEGSTVKTDLGSSVRIIPQQIFNNTKFSPAGFR